ncbi:hypothetical protein TNCV_3180531 [Trichonephila clavipes]|nr:hypothetical protein TNCV_3180531 [Trichonephila clavipes]
MKGENRRNRMKENVSNQENSRQNGEGGRVLENTNALSKQSAGGEGKNAGRQSGRLKAVNQGSDQSTSRTQYQRCGAGQRRKCCKQSVKSVFLSYFVFVRSLA